MLKQRLIGAAVLVALAVIFIPMVLESPDPEVPDMRAMPDESELPRGGQLRDLDVGESRALELPPVGVVTEPAATEPSVSELAEMAPAAGPAEPQPDVKPVPEPAPAAEPPAAPESPPETVAVAAPPETPAVAGGWVIQVGSFGNQSNADTLRDKLRADGFATQVERVILDSGSTTYRVRVGPYLDKGEAEETALKLGKSFDLKPRVMSR
jgi:DedD protein